MRAILVLVASLLALPALAGDGVLVKHFTVQVAGQDIRIAEASMNREFLVSWTENRDQRRDITLQPLGADGRRGPARTFTECTLGHASMIGPETVVSVMLKCRQ